MKIAVMGGAGLMGDTIIKDLLESPGVDEILIADYLGDKATQKAASFNDTRVKGCFVDGFDIETTAELLKSYDSLINAAQLYPNLFDSIMSACLKSGCHYNDLGGLFWTTKKLLERFDEFKEAGLTAILCMGSAPGITNILARYACDKLDKVESIELWYGVADMTDMQGIEAFNPPYSIRTIMQEFIDNPVLFFEGELKTLSPQSGARETFFPEPIGKRTCIHTLHSEPATLVPAFKNKGLKTCTWRLGLPEDFHEKCKFLASIGFGSKEPIDVRGAEVIPVEVLAAVIEKHVEEKLSGVDLKLNDMECIRAQVTGLKNGKKIEYVADCIAETHSRWGNSCLDVATGVPPSIVAQMQIKGMIKEPGVWGPEVIDPEYFFKELARREMRVEVTKKEVLT